MADRPKSRYLTFSILHIITLMCQALSEPPMFAEPIPNVTVALGRDVSLPCVVENLGTYKKDVKQVKAIENDQRTNGCSLCQSPTSCCNGVSYVVLRKCCTRRISFGVGNYALAFPITFSIL